MIDLDHAPRLQQPAPKTVQVRICVVVDDEGSWASSGWKGKEKVKDGILIDAAREMEITGPNSRVYFIDADLAPPTPETLQGTVEEVKP